MQHDHVSRMKEFLVPVRRHEMPVFIPGFLLYFCLSFVYNCLRPLKITLVTSASQAGAEIIPFLKVWGIMPGAVFFTYLFTRLSARYNREQTFYTIVAIFLLFHLFFATLLYPFSAQLSLDTLAGVLQQLLPSGLRGLVTMIQYWHLSIFYVFCEVWSSAVIFMLYWGFINEISTFEQAGRFYALYNLGGNIAATAAGYLLMYLCQPGAWLLPMGGSSEDCYSVTIILAAVGIGFLGMFFFRQLNRAPSIEQRGSDHYQTTSKEPGFTLRESFTHLVRSPHLLYILVLVVGYNLVFNLTDVLWSQKVKQFFAEERVAMTAYLGKVTMWKGICSSVLVLVAHLMIRRWGWRFTTLVTPVGIFVTSLCFFPLLYWHDHPVVVGIIHDWLGTSMLALAVTVGGIQSTVTRASKYSLYDTAREMAYIPLSTLMKRKGKAVIDGIASRFGKSSGSVIYMLLLPFCSSIDDTIPVVSLIVIVVSAFWIYCICRLDKLMGQENTVQDEVINSTPTEREERISTSLSYQPRSDVLT